jgi:A/G-specific adenine glycosylase
MKKSPPKKRSNGFAPQPSRLRSALLAWYAANRRDLPWRRTRDPYAIWVSEIMLQQTRVAVVEQRYQEFLRRFPTVFALAAAPEHDVLALWSGLGYYRRARMLHRAAQEVAATGGTIPQTAADLRNLPGIGAYTAAAIASIAHGEPVAVVDGNVERVLCRLAGWDARGGHQARVQELAGRLVDPLHPGDFNQAMMELGATVCLPRNPQCLLCPVAEFCRTRGEHKTARRPPAEIRPAGYALSLRSSTTSTEVLLEQRPATLSVMPSLWELPALRLIPDGDARITVRHSIMNVIYVVRVRDIREDQLAEEALPAGERRWVSLGDAAAMPLTGLARKVLKRITAPAAPSI